MVLKYKWYLKPSDFETMQHIWNL